MRRRTPRRRGPLLPAQYRPTGRQHGHSIVQRVERRPHIHRARRDLTGPVQRTICPAIARDMRQRPSEDGIGALPGHRYGHASGDSLTRVDTAAAVGDGAAPRHGEPVAPHLLIEAPTVRRRQAPAQVMHGDHVAEATTAEAAIRRHEPAPPDIPRVGRGQVQPALEQDERVEHGVLGVVRPHGMILQEVGEATVARADKRRAYSLPPVPPGRRQWPAPRGSPVRGRATK